QIARSSLLGKTEHSDREVVNDCSRALTVERDQRPGVTEANNAQRLILADHGETKHFLIELDGTLQIRDLNTDVVDVRSLEIDVVLGSDGRSAGRQHRETLNQFSTAE